MYKCIATFLACLHTCILSAWWDAGHMTMAQIAYDELEGKVRTEVDSLIKVFSETYPEMRDFVVASIWPDLDEEIACHPPKRLRTLIHWTNIPHDPDTLLKNRDKQIISKKNQERDVLTEIHRLSEILKNKEALAIDRAEALVLLTHFIADIHQPMHSTTCYSKKHIHGDLGGNLYSLKGKYTNLHLLWDAAGGALPEQKFIENPFSVNEHAQEVTHTYPQNAFSQRTPDDWAKESHELAAAFAYTIQENSEPSQEYLQNVQKFSKQRIAAAGHRLANLLNSLFREE